MKKTILRVLSLLLIMTFIPSEQLTAQIAGSNTGQTSNGSFPYLGLSGLTQEQIPSMRGNEFEWSMVMGVLYQFDDIRFGKIDTEGTALLFEESQNNASIYTKDAKLLLNDVNYNVEKDQFFTSVDKDSVFVFDFDYINKVNVSNRTFRKYTDYDKYTTRIYEVLYEGKNFSLLKKHGVQYITSSPNPMVNRPRNKIRKKHDFYIRTADKKMIPIRMSKGSVLRALGKENNAKLKEIIKSNDLKLRKEKDVISLMRSFEAVD